MVARDGVEPPTPAFSGAKGTVLAVTYKDVEGCEAPAAVGTAIAVVTDDTVLELRQVVGDNLQRWATTVTDDHGLLEVAECNRTRDRRRRGVRRHRCRVVHRKAAEVIRMGARCLNAITVSSFR